MPDTARFLLVCFDDVAPHNQRACEEFLPQLAQAGVERVSLLLVPRWHGVETVLDRPYFGRFLRALADQGHEICLHGTTHLRDDGELATACPVEAAAQLAEGADLCAQLGLEVSGFVPPCGRLSGAGRIALAERGFTYTVLGAEIDLLGCGRRLSAPVVAVEEGGAWQLPSWLRARALYFGRQRSPHLRLTVQPAALYHPAHRNTLLSLVRAALASRTAQTCGDLAAHAAL